MAEKNMQAEVLRTTMTFAVGIGLILVISYYSGWIGGSKTATAPETPADPTNSQAATPGPIVPPETYRITRLPALGLATGTLTTVWGEPISTEELAPTSGVPPHLRRVYQRSYGLVEVVIYQDAVVSVAISPRAEVTGFDPADTPDVVKAKIAGDQTWTALDTPRAGYTHGSKDGSILSSHSDKRVAVALASYVDRDAGE